MATFVPITRHKMPRPFKGMDGKNIEFVLKNETRTGEIVTAEDLDSGTFGMRIDWLVAVDDHGPLNKTYHISTYNLTREQILKVQQTERVDIPFKVVLD